jgi:hypothetical protein
MSDNSKIMQRGVIIAAMILLIRIMLEQVGAPEMVNNIFGVAWLYIIVPVLFAVSIRARECSNPYKVLLKDVLLFGVYTRLMVMITYMLAYFFRWNAPRFALSRGGNVGENVGTFMGVLIIPVRNALIWIVMVTILGMIIGSVTLLLKHKAPAPTTAA